MGGLSLLLRRGVRLQRGGILGLALVVMLVGGVALAALAGARRTVSTFPRYLEDSNATELAVDVFPLGEEVEETVNDTLRFAEQARGIDGVVGDASYIGLGGMYAFVDDISEVSGSIEVVGSFDGRFIDSDRVAVTDGRVPLPDRVDEVLLNPTAAELLGVKVGDAIRLVAVEGFGLADPRDAAIVGDERPTVVGIGLFPDEVLSDDVDRSGRLLTTPALTSRYSEDAGSYYWQGLHLAPGTDIERTIAAYESFVEDGYSVIVKRTDVQVMAVQRSIRPVALALAVFGALALVAAVVLGTFAGLRLVGDQAGDAHVLRAVGLPPRVTAVVLAGPALAGALLGAIGAGLIAVVLSPLAPIGAVRPVEPDRGIDVDLTVLGGGSALLVLALAGAALASGLAAARAATRPGVPLRTSTSRLTQLLMSVGASPAAVIGAGHALQPDGDGGRVPSRSTIVACTVAVVAIVGALVFGTNVRALIADPPRYGWTPDLAITSGGGYEYLDIDGVAGVADDPAVAGLTVTAFAPLMLAGTSVNAIGVLPVEGPPPSTTLRGRHPVANDEVALGAVTARRLGVSIGDTVAVDAGDALTVTGIVALPAVGPLAASHPSLGQGALLTLDALSSRNPGAYPVMALIDLAEGIAAEAEADRLKVLVAESASPLPAEAALVYRDLRPADIVALEPAQDTAVALAGALVVGAVAALAIALATSVRRRTGTFATLRALGFDRAQVRTAVRWEGNVVLGISLGIGLPLGIVLGRWGWTAFAEGLGALSSPTIPIAWAAVVTAVLVALGNLVAEGPARRATRSTVAAARDDRQG